MDRVIGRNWRAILLRGITATVFGLLAILFPAVASVTLGFLFGAYAVTNGIITVINALRATTHDSLWLTVLVNGVISLLAGATIFVWPSITGLTPIYPIAVWAIVTGILEIVSAALLRRQIGCEWTLTLAGIVSVFFGALLLVFPGAETIAAVTVIGVYALVLGILLVILAFQIRATLAPAA